MLLLYASILLTLNTTAHAQDYTYTTNNPDTNAVTITGYVGPDGDIEIPGSIGGKTVVSIGQMAFFQEYALTSVSIPNTVTSIAAQAFTESYNITNMIIGDGVRSIGDWAFSGCNGLTFIDIPSSVTSIGDHVFYSCGGLTNIIFPNSVTHLGIEMFHYCHALRSAIVGNGVTQLSDGLFDSCWFSLQHVTIGSSITNVGASAFGGDSSLTGVYFSGNAPSVHASAFTNAPNVVVYYLPGATGWTNTFGGRPTALWLPTTGSDDSLGLRDELFGFNVNWATGQSVVVEACTDMNAPLWIPLETNLLTNGTSYFVDAAWSNHFSRYYRTVPVP
jgi:hypothetical protein